MPNIKSLMERLEKTNRTHDLLRKGDRIVVGLSGGPDSTALLNLLNVFCAKYDLALFAAHLNHSLSFGAASYEKTARLTAKGLKVPFYSKKINIKKVSEKTGRSVEEAGRDERYRFFVEVAKRVRANKIATAHTIDDQAETMLFRIVRGAGLRGLAGIPARRSHGRYTVIRPLIDCEKKDLLDYLKRNKIRFAVDRSNKSLDFTRNRVRHELLPLIEKKFNPQTKKTLSQLQAVACEAQSWIDMEAQKAFKKCVRKAGGKIVALDLGRFNAYHPALRSEVVLRAVEALREDTRRIGHSHVAAILHTAANREDSLETHLPTNIVVQKRGGQLLFRFRGN